MTFAPNPLSREQKLMAEAIVQLGNIAESVQVLAGVDATSSTRIEELQTQVAELMEERTALAAKIAELQEQLNQDKAPVDITPDTLEQIMQHLSINYKQ